jgi:hypothetical protein
MAQRPREKSSETGISGRKRNWTATAAVSSTEIISVEDVPRVIVWPTSVAAALISMHRAGTGSLIRHSSSGHANGRLVPDRCRREVIGKTPEMMLRSSRRFDSRK